MGRLIPELPNDDRPVGSTSENYDVYPCFLTRPGRHYYIGCKLDPDKKVTRMGHITKLAAASNYREKDIGSSLVKKTIEAMGERRHTQKRHRKALVEVTLIIEGKDAHKSEKYGDHKQKAIMKAGSIQRLEI